MRYSLTPLASASSLVRCSFSRANCAVREIRLRGPSSPLSLSLVLLTHLSAPPPPATSSLLYRKEKRSPGRENTAKPRRARAGSPGFPNFSPARVNRGFNAPAAPLLLEISRPTAGTRGVYDIRVLSRRVLRTSNRSVLVRAKIARAKSNFSACIDISFNVASDAFSTLDRPQPKSTDCFRLAKSREYG